MLLTPVSIIGTGFLRQLISDDHAQPLLSWNELLKQVAVQHSLTGAFRLDCANTMPTLQWDELVCNYTASFKKSKPAYQSEQALKVTVARLLRECSNAAIINETKRNAFHSAAGKHVVSLNFDLLSIQSNDTGQSILSSSDADMPYFNLEKNSPHIKKVWFPHGVITHPKTIKLGMREYGAMANTWSSLFVQYKKVEREHLGNPGLIDEHIFQDWCAKLDKAENEITPSISLMGHLMLAPLVLFGVGMQPAEWGIWWLLNQRKRNAARLKEGTLPPATIILLKSGRKKSFWTTHPAGVTPKFPKSQKSAWNLFLKILQST